MTIKNIKNKLYDGIDLTLEETSYVFNKIMSGELSEIDVTGILIALKF